MAKYLVEISHEPEHSGCERTVSDFIDTGAREFTAADWGCLDNEHKAWLVLEARNRDAVKRLIPPHYRSKANIIQLSNLLLRDEELFEEYHKG
jgi:hypothetical protein